MNWIQTTPNVEGGQLRFRVHNYDGFHELLHLPLMKSASRGFVWRGHGSSTWTLRSTLQRTLDRVVRDTPELSDPEARRIFAQSVVALFKKASRGRRGANPRTLGMGEEEFWALGQHYGLATPFLDWTSSPYVAAYFAYREFDQARGEKNDHPVVWALDRNAVEYENAHLAEPPLRFFEPTADDNPRVVNQGGLFTHVPLEQSVEEWVGLLDRSDRHPFLLRIDLPADQRSLALASLLSMNISPLSLFPDLEGSALAINQMMELSPLQILRHDKWQPIDGGTASAVS